jgi:hypothetical protein
MRSLTAKLFVFFCFISFTAFAQTKEDKKLAKQMVGVWLLQKMSYHIDSPAPQNEAEKKRVEEQQALMNKNLEQTNAEIKNKMAITFEKKGGMQVVSYEKGIKKATKGTWKLENNRLQATLEDKEVERTFNKTKVKFQNDTLELFFDKSEEGVEQIAVIVLQFSKGALTDLKASLEAEPKK